MDQGQVCEVQERDLGYTEMWMWSCLVFMDRMPEQT